MQATRWVVLTLVILLAGCCGPDDQACTDAQYNAIQSWSGAAYNVGAALHR